LSFLEEKQHVFSGSLAENLRFSNPEATEGEMLAALTEFQVLSPEATIRDIHSPVAVLTSDSLLRRFGLVRVFIKRAPVYLLDEPSLYLDADADALLRQKIEALKGRATIVMATVQPAYMRIASRVILMQAGRVWAQGAPDATLPLLMQSPRQIAEAKASAPPARQLIRSKQQ
jgi:ABC-type transport system involved in cytochrome bd biosynthesis fused ATPase/permease subunit